jgi:hypothetical protein
MERRAEVGEEGCTVVDTRRLSRNRRAEGMAFFALHPGFRFNIDTAWWSRG